MKPTLLNIRERAIHPEFYDKTRDMETSIAWSSIKKTLENIGSENLFSYIKSVRLTEKNIVITTGKPIVNQELKNHRETIIHNTNNALSAIGAKKRLNLRVN